MSWTWATLPSVTTQGQLLQRLNLRLKELEQQLGSGEIVTTLLDDATPSVLGGHLFKTGGTTPITDFDDGVIGQELVIISAHTVTITDGAPIILAGSGNFGMLASDTLNLRMFDDQVWQETSRSVN